MADLALEYQLLCGAVGGVCIVGLKLDQYFKFLSKKERETNTVVRLGKWDKWRIGILCGLVPIGAGLAAIAQAHNPFLAFYEGMALPAIVFSVNNHYKPH